MPSALRRVEPAVRELADLQAGVISRAQLRRARFTPGQTRAELAARRWTVLVPGVYLTHTGDPSPEARIWAAVLHADPGAVVTGKAALWLAGAVPASSPPAVVQIAVPERRQVAAGPGLNVVRRRHLARDTLPRSSPPRVTVEAALLEAASGESSTGAVLGLAFGAIQRRTTSAPRVLDALTERRGHRWSALLREVLADAAAGVQSPLEQRYVTDVERAHGLPVAAYNHADLDLAGRRRYRDAKYPEWGVVIELDGREAHPREWAHRDRRRDNHSMLQGLTTLRYGWREIAADPCGAATEVTAALRAGGWQGAPRRCPKINCAFGSL